jgi:biopolymer transport protein ExbD
MQIQEDKPYDEINITPMLDLAYVLLVIFILMTTATVTGLKASLPRASRNSAPPPKESIMKAITIDNDGRIILDKRVVSLPEVEALLRAHKTKHADFPVVIKGNSTTPYQSVVDVVELVNTLGIRQIGLPTQARK